MATTRSIFRLLRVQHWYYQMGIPLLAILNWQKLAIPSRVFQVFIFSSVCFCWGYVFNNLFDQDEADIHKNLFKRMPAYLGRTITFALQLILLMLSVYENLFLATLFVVALNASYSVPPFRLTNHFIWSLVLNGLFFSFSFYASTLILVGGVDGECIKFSRFIVLLLALCLASQKIYSWANYLYATGCFLTLIYFQSAKKALAGIRGLSFAFGIYMAAVPELGYLSNYNQ